MPTLDVELDGDGCWPDLLRPPGFERAELVAVAVLPNGTLQGNPTVAVRIKLADGSTVLAETTVRLFLMAAAAIRGRYGEP